MNGIEIRQVFKRYGAVQALSNVNICFGEQKIYGLLGRNGLRYKLKNLSSTSLR